MTFACLRFRENMVSRVQGCVDLFRKKYFADRELFLIQPHVRKLKCHLILSVTIDPRPSAYVVTERNFFVVLIFGDSVLIVCNISMIKLLSCDLVILVFYWLHFYHHFALSLNIITYSGRQKYNPFSKKVCTFAEKYLGTQAW